jgi:amino acid transporter
VLALNIAGIRIAGTFQDILAYLMFACLIATSIYAIVTAPGPLHTPTMPGHPASFAKAVAVGVFLYVGFEWVTPLAEEVTDHKLIARGLFWTIWLLFLSYALFNAGLTMTMAPAIQANPQDPMFAPLIDAAISKGAIPAGVDRAALTYDQAKQAFGTSVVPHVLFYRYTFGGAGIVLVIALSLMASVTSFNAGTITASRFMYALARDGSLPRVFSRISIRFATPYMALIALSALCMVISVAVFVSARYDPESYELFIYVGAFIECLIYAVMACAVMALRRREPGHPRPYRVPGGDVIPVIVAIFFGFLMITIVIDQPLVGAVVAVAAGLAAYYGWRVVPAMRAKARAARGARSPRRPGRRQAGSDAP